MILLLFFALLAIGASVFVFKKVNNKIFRYSLMAILWLMALGIFWIIWIALQSGEM
jgi:hypothetical protein